MAPDESDTTQAAEIRGRIAYVIQLWRDRADYRSRSATQEDATRSMTWWSAANELEHAMATLPVKP